MKNNEKKEKILKKYVDNLDEEKKLDKYIKNMIKTKDSKGILSIALKGNLSKKSLDNLTKAIIKYGYIKEQIDFLEGVKNLTKENKKDLIFTILNSKDVSYYTYLYYFAKEYDEITEEMLNSITDRLISSKHTYYLCNFVRDIKDLSNNNINKIIDCLTNLNFGIENIIYYLSKCDKLTNKNIDDLTKHVCSSNHGYYIYEYTNSFKRYLSIDDLNKLADAIIKTDNLEYIKLFNEKIINLNKNYEESIKENISKLSSNDLIKYIINNKDINILINLFNTRENFINYCLITDSVYKDDAINFIKNLD